jgi:peptidoglycan hydrolase CwlO-like protein
LIQVKEDEHNNFKAELKEKTKQINEIRAKQVELKASISSMKQNLSSLESKLKTYNSDLEGLSLQTTGYIFN